MLFVANSDQVMGEVLMLEEIQNQISINFLRQIFTAIIYHRWKNLIYRDDFQFYGLFGIFANAGNFFLTTALLLKHDYFLSRSVVFTYCFHHIPSFLPNSCCLTQPQPLA